MDREERIAARTAMIFPRDRLKRKAIECPTNRGEGIVNSLGNGGFPQVGGMCETVPWCILEDGFVYDPLDIHGSRPGEDGRVDIARRTRSLISLLRNFSNGDITHPDARAECEDEWSPDYAIICDAYSPWGDGVYSDYFDHDRCLEDFIKLVRDHFACDPTVKVHFHNVPHGSNEIEITRQMEQ